MKGKKAVIEIQVRWIVWIIIAILFIVLAVFFVKHTFKSSSEKIEEVISSVPVPAPNAKINLAGSDYEVYDNINFDASFSYDNQYEIKHYFWDFGDGFHEGNGIDKIRINHTYYNPGYYNVTLKAVNSKGGLGVDSVIVKVFSKNIKNASKYSGNPVFIIHDNGNNWRDILQLMPLTGWYSKDSSMHSYSYVIYRNKQGIALSNASAEELINSHNGSTEAIIFDSEAGITPSEDIKTGSLSPAKYLEYWNTTYSVVLVDYDNKNDSLIASLFASYSNSPLFFVNSTNINNVLKPLKPGFKYLTIYFIGAISQPELNYLTESGLSYKRYTANDLRNSNVNRIARIESDINIS